MGAGSPLIQLTISLPSSRLQQWLTGEGICRQLWGLRRHNYCSLVISPVTSHIVDIIISKAPTVWVFRWRKCEDPIHLPLRLLSKPGECQPNPPGTQTFNSLPLLVRRKNMYLSNSSATLEKELSQRFRWNSALQTLLCNLWRLDNMSSTEDLLSLCLSAIQVWNPDHTFLIAALYTSLSWRTAQLYFHPSSTPDAEPSTITWDSRVERLIKSNYYRAELQAFLDL